VVAPRATGRGIHDIVRSAGADADAHVSAVDPLDPALTIAADVLVAGTIIFEADEAFVPVAGDNLTVNAGVRVTSTAENVFLFAGDNVVINGTVAAFNNVQVESNVADNDLLGDITVTGIVGQDAAVPVTAVTNVLLSRNNVTLGGATDGTLVSTGTTAVTAGADGTGAIVLGNTNVGALSLAAAGTITDDPGASAVVAGITGITATNGLGTLFDVTLDNPANNFATVLINAANNVTLADATGINFGTSTVSGNLILTSAGAVTDSGVVQVAGTTTLTNGALNDITFDNADDFVGAISIVSARNVILNDTNALIFGASTISGTLGATAPTGMTQVGAITVAGVATLNTATADVTLTNAANDFFTVGVTAARHVSLRDANAIDLGASTLTGNLSVQGGGLVGNDITDSGALSVAGTTTLTAGAANVTFDNANDFVGAVSVVSANNAIFNDVNAFTLGPATLAGSLTVTAAGLIDDAGVITVPGTTTLTAGAANNIDWNDFGHNFVGVVSVVSANDALFNDVNAFTLGPATISGNLTVTAAGLLDDAGVIAVTGTTSLTAGAANNIDWNDFGHNFGGAVSVVSANDALFNDVNGFTFGPAAISGNLTITGAGLMDDAGIIAVTGTTTLTAGAANNIDWDDFAHNFGGAVSVVSANNALLNDVNAFTFGPATISGNLTITAAGLLEDAGVIAVTGTTTLTAGAANNIDWNDFGHDFGGAVSVVSANNALFNDVNAFTLGPATISGSLTITAAGLIDDAGVIAVTGTTSLTAGAANNIDWNDFGHDFVGAVSVVSANNALFNDVNAFTLGPATISGSLTITAAGLIDDAGVIAVTGTTTLTAGAANDIDWNDFGHDFIGSVSVVIANDVTLLDVNSIDLGASTLTGNLTVQGGGAPGNNITDSGALFIGGTTTLIAGAGSVTLNNANDFVGAVTITSANQATLNDVNALVFGGVSTVTGNLVVTAGGAITDLAGTTLSVSGTAGFTTTGGGITLADTAGDVLTVGGAATFTAAGQAISVGAAGLVDSGAAVNLGSLTFTGTVVTVSENSSMSLFGASTAAGSTATLASETGSVTDAGGAGDTVTATMLAVTASTGIGTAGNTLSTFVGTLEATTATGGVFVTNVGALTLGDVNSANGISVLVTAAGDVTITALSPLTVAADVIAPGNITLTAGEISDAPVWADDLTVNSFVTVQSTAGNVTLRAGDDVNLLSDSNVIAFGNVTIQAGFGDLDGRGNVTLDGTITAGGTITVTSIGDIILGLVIGANGLNLTTTTGSILDGNGEAPNVVVNGRSVWNAAGVIGLPWDPIELDVRNGQLITNAGSAFDEVSVSLRGRLDPHGRPFATRVPPGLILFDYGVYGGDNSEEFEHLTAELNIRSTGERDHGVPGFFTGSMLYLDEVWSPDALYEWDATLEQGPVSQR